MNQPVCAQQVFQALENALDLRWLGGALGAERVLWLSVEASIPFFGRLNWVQPPRLQVIGAEESVFLQRMAPAIRETLIRELLEPAAGAVLVCGDLDQAEALRPIADAAGIPLWYTPAQLGVALEQLNSYRYSLDASTVVHGLSLIHI